MWRRRPIFKTKMLLDETKANFDMNILYGTITHVLDPKACERLLWERKFHPLFWPRTYLSSKFKFDTIDLLAILKTNVDRTIFHYNL